MNPTFIFFALVMLAAALALILPPMLRGARAGGQSAGGAKRRLKALKYARDEGIVDEAEYLRQRALLGDALLADIDGHCVPARFNMVLALLVALLLPATAFVLYAHIGQPRALDPAAVAAAPQGTDAPEHGSDIQQAIDGLAAKLKQNPDDAEGWALLGRAYKETQRFSEARDAFKRAYDLKPNEADMMVEYAEAQVLAGSDRHIVGEPRSLLEKALSIDAKNQRALWLLGIADAQDGKYDDAIVRWNALLAVLPLDSDVAKSVQKQIARAQAQRDGKAVPPDDDNAAADETETAAVNSADTKTTSSAQTDGPRLSVHVALDSKLQAKAKADDVVFVFAKAASGPPMPLAVQRLKVSQLPTTVVLTDGMGMLPTMKLSQFPRVVIGARISKSGNAVAQSGDLQTVSQPMDVSVKTPVTLSIDQVVP